LNLHGVLFDELHTQPSRHLWDVLRTGTSARRQPLIFAMTTAGYDRQSICWEVHDYATKVAAGIIADHTFLPVLYGITPERLARDPECWQSPAVWSEVNPNLGVSKKQEYMVAECQRAIDTPANENTFKRLELNIWTEQSVKWMPMATWDRCDQGPLDPAAFAGRECYAGLDLAATIDVAALVLLFPPTAAEHCFTVLPYFFIPRDTIQLRERQQKTTYRPWVDQQLMIATEGNVIDYDVIRACLCGPKALANSNPQIMETLPARLAAWRVPPAGLASLYQIKELSIDRWNSTQLQTQLQGDGLTVVQFGQGFASMSAPTKELEKLILAQRVNHGGHPVLRWMASNLSVKQDPAGNLKPDKASSSEKIDGLVALIMALGRAMVQPAAKKSIYEERGLTTV
ncbi:MAG: terminase large subunit, partial [Pseudonocardiaceae bacterium]